MAGNDLEKEEKTFDILPVKKGRRMLIYLADFFVVLIISMILFNIAVYPLSKLATGSQKKEDEAISYTRQRMDILYNNGLLFYEENEKYYYDGNLETTAKKSLGYYLGIEGNTDVITTYFVDFRGQKTTKEVKEEYVENDKSYGFFEYDETNEKLSIKGRYIEEFNAYFDEKDSLTSQAEADFERFTNTVFLKLYSEVMKDIEEKDLRTSTVDKSYIELSNLIVELKANDVVIVQVAAIISFVITSVGMCIVLPMVNRKGRTLGLIVLKEERVQSDTIRITNKSDRAIGSIFNIIFQLPCLLFIPYPTISFAELFGMSALFIVTMISLVVLIVSIIYLFISAYNQTLSDKLTKTIIIDTVDLDEVYKKRGLYI